MVKTVMESGTRGSALHLKIVAYDDDSARGAALQLKLLELKQVLMPRQWFLNKPGS